MAQPFLTIRPTSSYDERLQRSLISSTTRKICIAQQELAKCANAIRVTSEQGIVLFFLAPRITAMGIMLPILFLTACLVLGLWLVSAFIPAFFPAFPLIGLGAGLIILSIKLKNPLPPCKIAQWNENTATLALYEIDAENKLCTMLTATDIAHLEIWHTYQSEDRESGLFLIGLQEERTLLFSEIENPSVIDSMGTAFGYLLDKKIFRRNTDKTMEWLPEPQ